MFDMECYVMSSFRMVFLYGILAASTLSGCGTADPDELGYGCEPYGGTLEGHPEPLVRCWFKD